MSESEARAQAFVSGFCISDGRGNVGDASWAMDESSSVNLARSQLFSVNLWHGRTPFRFVTSGVPPKEEFQSRALGKSEGTTRTMVKNWGLGAWQSQYAVSPSSH